MVNEECCRICEQKLSTKESDTSTLLICINEGCDNYWLNEGCEILMLLK